MICFIWYSLLVHNWCCLVLVGVSSALSSCSTSSTSSCNSTSAPPPPPPPQVTPPPPPPPPSKFTPPAPPPPVGMMPAPDGAMTIKRKVQTKYKLPSLNWIALKPNQVCINSCFLVSLQFKCLYLCFCIGWYIFKEGYQQLVAGYDTGLWAHAWQLFKKHHYYLGKWMKFIKKYSIFIK